MCVGGMWVMIGWMDYPIHHWWVVASPIFPSSLVFVCFFCCCYVCGLVLMFGWLIEAPRREEVRMAAADGAANSQIEFVSLERR